MSDLVQRLRLQAQTYTRDPWHSDLYKEAADEIERLSLAHLRDADEAWETEARAHIDRIDREQPDRAKWIPATRWLAQALDQLDNERTAMHEETAPNMYRHS